MNILGIIASGISGHLAPSNFIAVAYSDSPYISAYPWSAGFGTKYADPATLPTDTGRSVAFKPQGDAIAVAHDTTP
jgi:hypothetical protein